MDPAAELGRNPVSTIFSLSMYVCIMEMSRLTRDGTAEPVSRDQILRRERGQGNIHFPCSADHEQDWQPYPVDPYYSCLCVATTYKTHKIRVFTRSFLFSSMIHVRVPVFRIKVVFSNHIPKTKV